MWWLLYIYCTEVCKLALKVKTHTWCYYTHKNNRTPVELCWFTFLHINFILNFAYFNVTILLMVFDIAKKYIVVKSTEFCSDDLFQLTSKQSYFAQFFLFGNLQKILVDCIHQHFYCVLVGLYLILFGYSLKLNVNICKYTSFLELWIMYTPYQQVSIQTLTFRGLPRD